MNAGIQYTEGLSIDNVCKSGLDNIELYIRNYAKLDEIKAAGARIAGICFSLKDMIISGNNEEILKEKAHDIFKYIVTKAIECEATYIVIETEGVNKVSILEQLVSESMSWLEGENVSIYIENGYKQYNNRFYHNEYSDGTALMPLINRLSELCPSVNWKICINIGHANLLGMNIRDLIRVCKENIGLVHASDNDGISDMHQMPYTFTTGRGYTSTDWVHAIGMLHKCGYDGYYIFDTKGLWKRTPAELHSAMLQLVKSVADEWNESCYKTEEYLNQPEKQLILFGSGRMAQSYMEAWGEKYRPDFIVDNNPERWGHDFMGIPINSPDEILSLLPDERNVWICNMNYDIIGRQLEDMGIEYRCYWDHYHMDYIV